MLMRVVQTWNGARDAQFEIRIGDAVVGGAALEAGRLPLRWRARILCRGKEGGIAPGGLIGRPQGAPSARRALLAYGIASPAGGGSVSRMDMGALLRRPDGRYALRIGEEEYLGYAASYGQDGFRLRLHSGGECVIDIRKPGLVQNNLHEFDAFLADGAAEPREWAAAAACCYLWAVFFRDGGGMSGGWRQAMRVTKDKELLSVCGAAAGAPSC